jgi:hypothetical protein
LLTASYVAFGDGVGGSSIVSTARVDDEVAHLTVEDGTD